VLHRLCKDLPVLKGRKFLARIGALAVGACLVVSFQTTHATATDFDVRPTSLVPADGQQIQLSNKVAHDGRVYSNLNIGGLFDFEATFAEPYQAVFFKGEAAPGQVVDKFASSGFSGQLKPRADNPAIWTTETILDLGPGTYIWQITAFDQKNGQHFSPKYTLIVLDPPVTTTTVPPTKAPPPVTELPKNRVRKNPDQDNFRAVVRSALKKRYPDLENRLVFQICSLKRDVTVKCNFVWYTPGLTYNANVSAKWSGDEVSLIAVGVQRKDGCNSSRCGTKFRWSTVESIPPTQ
jgi:hypothetical protein